MSVNSKDPRAIHDACKEAVVDSLLNNLSARISGRRENYRIIYGNKPSAVLMSEFIVPIPAEERGGDEESDPIQISAHGMDFQIRTEDAHERISVRVNGAIYVRILPSENDLKVGGRLEISFPLTGDARRELRIRIRDGLSKLEKDLLGGRKHIDWPTKSLEVRTSAYKSMDLPFVNAWDRTQATGEPTTESEAESEATEGGEQRPVQAVPVSIDLPDSLASPVLPPSKWLRLDLNLSSFEFSCRSAEADAKRATEILNSEIRQQLANWASSKDENIGGQVWGYRRGLLVRPSNVRDWSAYLNSVRTSKKEILLPEIELRWVVSAVLDPIDPSRTTVHLAIENWTKLLNKSSYKELEPSFFQVSISTQLPAKAHLFLHLDRVKPSYRYNRYLTYPALGFNGGVVLEREREFHRLTTTWAPRYVLPRIVPTVSTVERNIEKLADPECLPGLNPILESYEDWLGKVSRDAEPTGNDKTLTTEEEQQEESRFNQDKTAWRSELAAIRSGLEILKESKKHWSGPGMQESPLGVPFEAWLSMNTAMAKVAKSKGYEDWRLFQLAFILASLPTFATRIFEFHRFYTPEVSQHANAVTLLYFATGGGKSEAFLGLLVYVLFLDRLRGKSHGVSALMRYPLRLLTLQQARRTFAAIGAAEEVRDRRKHSGEPFSLGFWVGGANTPNWHSEDGYTDAPTDAKAPPDEEIRLMESQPYKGARERWLKLTNCPFCGSRDGNVLALRRWAGNGRNALGHFCTSKRSQCSWNSRFELPTPLPFYIVDEDIYDLAPSVLLGTVDKLSALGQSQGTIRKFFGMFGFAPLIENGSERLFIPFMPKDWDGEPGGSTKPLFPSFEDGEKRFFDPFPSLLIQDEAHLLDESLGTFSGLFESALEAGFDQLAPLLGDQLSFEPGTRDRRKIKVIAASATVSEPQRQMRNLYQRPNTIQFPHPGPDLYRSFYAIPKAPGSGLEDVERHLIPESNVEVRSSWARVYCSILTNGHRHTVAMASVLGHYHLIITGLYERLQSDDKSLEAEARAELICWVSPGVLHSQHVRLLQESDAATLLTLVDLHRISLTYVTNKKGGDQVIDTEKTESEKLHKAAGFPNHALASELISGAVSAAGIQEIVRRAEKRVGINQPFPDLNSTLRSVIATSAISHGVDVEEFNAMFFAGMPSDVAEYIQASSRVGRTHVGFSLLIPVPQRHRDRFVLEIHDIFHRFLERMILPAAVDRWAEKALVRVMPSFFQEYVCGINAIKALCGAKPEKKRALPFYAMAMDARRFLAIPANLNATEAFMERALGLMFSPSPEGRDYYKALLREQLNRYQQGLEVDSLVNATRLVKFFEGMQSMLRPMTSLRDVDQPGVIHEANIDAGAKRVKEDATARVMLFIRRGSGADIDSLDDKMES